MDVFFTMLVCGAAIAAVTGNFTENFYDVTHDETVDYNEWHQKVDVKASLICAAKDTLAFFAGVLRLAREVVAALDVTVFVETGGHIIPSIVFNAVSLNPTNVNDPKTIVDMISGKVASYADLKEKVRAHLISKNLISSGDEYSLVQLLKTQMDDLGKQITEFDVDPLCVKGWWDPYADLAVPWFLFATLEKLYDERVKRVPLTIEADRIQFKTEYITFHTVDRTNKAMMAELERQMGLTDYKILYLLGKDVAFTLASEILYWVIDKKSEILYEMLFPKQQRNVNVIDGINTLKLYKAIYTLLEGLIDSRFRFDATYRGWSGRNQLYISLPIYTNLFNSIQDKIIKNFSSFPIEFLKYFNDYTS